MASAIIFGSFAVLLCLNVPIAIAIGAAVALYCFVIGGVPISYLSNALFSSCDSFTTMAVPFFIAAGAIMEGGGLSKRLVSFSNSLVGHFRGGMSIVAVVTCMFFAAISGSSPATVAAIGAIIVPSMIKQGYPKGFTVALIATAGTLGVIIPPSIPMVIYGVSTNTSIGALFLGGFGPGLVLGGLMIAYALWYCRKHNIAPAGEKFSIKRVWKEFKSAIWALLVPVIILGGIYGSLFTPTEAAAVSCIYGFIAGKFIYKELTLKNFYTKMVEACTTTGSVMIIVGTSTILGRIMTIEHIPQAVAGTMTQFADQPMLVLALITVFLLIVGCLMETSSAILIVSPLLLPVATMIGMNPVHFGLVLICNLAIGFITPPVGVNLFVASGMFELSFSQLVKKILPFILVMFIAYLIIMFWEPLTMFLPRITGMA